MSGRGRLEIGTYGDISTTRTGTGTVRAEARYRDGDGIVRKVTATAGTAKQAKQNLRLKLQRRNPATGFGTARHSGVEGGPLSAERRGRLRAILRLSRPRSIPARVRGLARR